MASLAPRAVQHIGKHIFFTGHMPPCINRVMECRERQTMSQANNSLPCQLSQILSVSPPKHFNSMPSPPSPHPGLSHGEPPRSFTLHAFSSLTASWLEPWWGTMVFHPDTAEPPSQLLSLVSPSLVPWILVSFLPSLPIICHSLDPQKLTCSQGFLLRSFILGAANKLEYCSKT